VPLYSLDKSWRPKFPQGSHTFSGVGIGRTAEYANQSAETKIFVTQRGNSSVAPVLVLNSIGEVEAGWGKAHIGLDKTNPAAPTWGSHGIAVESCSFPCSGDVPITDAFLRIWIDDFTNHTLTAFSTAGKPLLQLGTNGEAGNGTDPLQFGNVADSAIQTGYVVPSSAPSPSIVFSSDGDGGTANRVTAVEVGSGSAILKWATGAIFNNPHSITLHETSGLLIVANREGNETRLLRSSSGEDLGAWNCGIDYGAAGKPFGVRMYGSKLLFVAIMNNPQDGHDQRIAVIDTQHLTAETGAQSKCEVLQMIAVPTHFSGPHLLGVDQYSGDLYAALVSDTPLSTVIRFTCTGCN